MANICSNKIVITGKKYPLQRLKNFIEVQEKDFILTHWWLKKESEYGLVDAEYDDSSIILYVQTKWLPPKSELSTFSCTHPELEINVTYAEPVDELFGRLKIKNGNMLREEIEPYEYYINNDLDFQAEVNDIKNMDYEEFLNEYISKGGTYPIYYEEGCLIPGYEYLERHIVEKIKYKDLPLMINWEWSGDGELFFKERIEHGVDND